MPWTSLSPSSTIPLSIRCTHTAGTTCGYPRRGHVELVQNYRTLEGALFSGGKTRVRVGQNDYGVFFYLSFEFLCRLGALRTFYS